MLAVGTLEPRKNLGAATEAARLAGVELRVVGARGWGGVDAPGWSGRVDDAELAALYRGARCLVYPSLYEGFGHPGAGGDGVRDARRHVAWRRHSRRSPAAPRCSSTRTTRRRSPPASTKPRAGAHELVPLGLERAAAFTWSRAADLVERLWRELA